MKIDKSNGENDRCVFEQLVQMRGRIVKGMQEFGKDEGRLQNAAEWLPRALNIEREHLRWATQGNKLLNEAQEILNPSSVKNQRAEVGVRGVEIQKKPERQSYGGKELADQFRRAYLKRESSRGRNLEKASLRGPYYKDARGLVTGITFSSELKPGKRWWVNWKKDSDEVVILCLVRPDAVQIVHLPKHFFKRYGDHLRAGTDGLIQITIREKTKKFCAVVTGIGEVDISEQVDTDLLTLSEDDACEYFG